MQQDMLSPLTFLYPAYIAWRRPVIFPGLDIEITPNIIFALVENIVLARALPTLLGDWLG